ncbi:MAG: hypothetical protein JNJ94_12735 [Chlorobi bacterium]|nr:hypothetical protein [Chlorobiota bacterium]
MATLDKDIQRTLYRVPVGFQLLVYAESSESATDVAAEEAEALGERIHTHISVGTPIEVSSSGQIPTVWKDKIPLTDAIDFLELTSEELLSKERE